MPIKYNVTIESKFIDYKESYIKNYLQNKLKDLHNNDFDIQVKKIK